MVLLSDVCTADGGKVEEEYYNGTKKREIKLHWPEQVKPDDISWAEWRKLLRRVTIGSKNDLNLNRDRQLGNWYETHQKWEWTGNGKEIWNTSEGIKYTIKKENRTMSIYERTKIWDLPAGEPVTVVSIDPLVAKNVTMRKKKEKMRR